MANARFEWALDVLDPRAGERLLEIGCGTGKLAVMVAEKLESGHVVAVDRSARVLATASDDARLSFMIGELTSLTLPRASFDKIYAFNVSGLWGRDAADMLGVVRRALKPRGTLYVFHQPPSASRSASIEAAILARLQEHGFTVTRVVTASMTPAPATCVTARRTRGSTKPG